ncbi:MAG: phosphohydrolase [Chloroflexi bacterium]|nr:phosphohydrolase [Chloroflexota bacterium]
MMELDFDGAKSYALDRLERELAPQLTYHSVWHTSSDVVPATERLAVRSGVEGLPLVLLMTAAWFHDIGFVETRKDHEAVGVRIAAQVLPNFGYTADQIELIGGIIMATKLPQRPQTLLEQIMADADLDNLGRDDFPEVSDRLRQERANYGGILTDLEWYQEEVAFLRSHRYFTAAARDLRNAGKARNLEAILSTLSEIEG